MRYSYIAAEIDREFRIKKAFEKKMRQKCIIEQKKQCVECKYQEICEGDKDEGIDSNE